jgi:hypothetical protein
MNNDSRKEEELEIITENSESIPAEPEDISKQAVINFPEKEETKLEKFILLLENYGARIVNWIKASIAMMIIFILIGGAGGLYIAKIIYDFRMSEVTRVGGFVYDNRVFDVKLRP